MTERSPVVADDHATDWAVLELLLDADEPLWSIEELSRALGDRLAVGDSVARLHRAGLIHRLQTFVFATRPARYFDQLQG